MKHRIWLKYTEGYVGQSAKPKGEWYENIRSNNKVKWMWIREDGQFTDWYISWKSCQTKIKCH